MGSKLLADALVVIHFLWILFMLVGFFLTFWDFFRLYCLRRSPRFFDRWIFRTIHLAGILYVAVLALLGRNCPLTIWEYNLRLQYDPGLIYPGSFIAFYIEKLVYPAVHPLAILIPTIFLGAFTFVVFVIRPPEKIQYFLSRLKKYF